MTRAERLKAALCALVDERRDEIDGIREMHGVSVRMTFDLAGCIEFEEVHYEIKRHRRRQPNTRSQVA